MKKKPRLFYYEDAVNAFIPVPDKIEGEHGINVYYEVIK